MAVSKWAAIPCYYHQNSYESIEKYGSVSKPCTPVVHIKIAGKWMFIPLKMVLIGIDPSPYRKSGDQPILTNGTFTNLVRGEVSDLAVAALGLLGTGRRVAA